MPINQTLSDFIDKNQNPAVYSLHEMHLTYKNTNNFKNKRIEKRHSMQTLI